MDAIIIVKDAQYLRDNLKSKFTCNVVDNYVNEMTTQYTRQLVIRVYEGADTIRIFDSFTIPPPMIP